MNNVNNMSHNNRKNGEKLRECERDRREKIGKSFDSLNSSTVLEVPGFLDLTTHGRNLKRQEQMNIKNLKRKLRNKE